MRFTYQEIKKELSDHLDEMDQDDLNNWADSFVPVYYNEILKDWAEMPSEFNDSWQEYGPPSEDATIFSLMRADLFAYYLDQCQTALDELTKERDKADTE